MRKWGRVVGGFKAHRLASLPPLCHKGADFQAQLLDKAPHAVLDGEAGHVFRDLEVLAVQQHGLAGRLVTALGVRDGAGAPHAVEGVHAHDVILHRCPRVLSALRVSIFWSKCVFWILPNDSTSDRSQIRFHSVKGRSDESFSLHQANKSHSLTFVRASRKYRSLCCTVKATACSCHIVLKL